MLLENLHNFNKMSSSNDKNETQTQESFRSKTTFILDNLLPPKSREMLVPENIKKICDWKPTNGDNFFSESVFQNYFNESTKTKEAVDTYGA